MDFFAYFALKVIRDIGVSLWLIGCIMIQGHFSERSSTSSDTERNKAGETANKEEMGCLSRRHEAISVQGSGHRDMTRLCVGLDWKTVIY